MLPNEIERFTLHRRALSCDEKRGCVTERGEQKRMSTVESRERTERSGEILAAAGGKNGSVVDHAVSRL